MAVLAVAIAAFALRQPWRSPAQPEPVMSPAVDPVAMTEAQRHLAHVRKILADVENGATARNNLELADELTAQAVKLEPANAEAWALAAEVPAGLWHSRYDFMPERQAKIHTQAARALRLGSELAGAQYAHAMVLGRSDRTKPEAERAERTVRELARTTGTWVNVGFCVPMGRYDEAISGLEGQDRAGDLSARLRAFLSLSPVYDPLRGNPRFEALLAKPAGDASAAVAPANKPDPEP